MPFIQKTAMQNWKRHFVKLYQKVFLQYWKPIPATISKPERSLKSANTTLSNPILALVIGLVVAAFQFYGIINLRLAHFLIVVAWIITSIAASIPLLSEPKSRIWKLVLGRSLSLAIIFIALDALMVKFKPVPESPDIFLQFVYPQSPSLLVKNQSNVLARDVKYQTVVFNMDLPELKQPLPILVEEVKWIKPKDEVGPNAIFATQHVSPFIKPGNRLVGSVAVNCAECSRGRTYYVYIVWGTGGWYVEKKDEESGRNFGPAMMAPGILEEYLKLIESNYPLETRTQIRNE